jgi:hypothetical protein
MVNAVLKSQRRIYPALIIAPTTSSVGEGRDIMMSPPRSRAMRRASSIGTVLGANGS